MKGKKAAEELTVKKIITIIIVILVLVILLIAVFNFNITGIFKDLFPEFKPISEQIIYSDVCPIKVAKLVDNTKIKFCIDKECKNLLDTKLFFKKNQIKVDQDWKINPVIGEINRLPIMLKSEIVNREGILYSKVARDLPDFYYILRLHLSYFWESDKTLICRDEEVFENVPASSTWIAEVRYIIKYLPIFSWKNMIFTADTSVKTRETGISIEGNYLQVGSTKIGEIVGNKITIYQKYLENPEIKGLKNSWILKDLNGSEKVQGKIYKKKA